MQTPAGASKDSAQLARSAFEHEVAGLDLSEAAQAAVQSSAVAERGDTDESQRLAELASRLYRSADLHRDQATRLEDTDRGDPG